AHSRFAVHDAPVLVMFSQLSHSNGRTSLWIIMTFLTTLLALLLASRADQKHKTTSSPIKPQKEGRLLSSRNIKDVQEFQKILHKADLNYARRILNDLRDHKEHSHRSQIRTKKPSENEEWQTRRGPAYYPVEGPSIRTG